MTLKINTKILLTAFMQWSLFGGIWALNNRLKGMVRSLILVYRLSFFYNKTVRQLKGTYGECGKQKFKIAWVIDGLVFLNTSVKLNISFFTYHFWPKNIWLKLNNNINSNMHACCIIILTKLKHAILTVVPDNIHTPTGFFFYWTLPT